MSGTSSSDERVKPNELTFEQLALAIQDVPRTWLPQLTEQCLLAAIENKVWQPKLAERAFNMLFWKAFDE